MTATPTRSVERALQVLDIVCDSPGLCLVDVARRADLAASSTFRVLRTLMDTGHVVRTDDGLYLVGPQMIWLGGRVLANDSLRRICEPTMRELAASTGESIHLSVRHRERVLYLEVVPGSQVVEHRHWEGEEIPVRGTAAGRALTGLDRDAGFSMVTAGVEHDVTAIAAPVVLGDRPVAALSMIVPTYRLDDASTGRFCTLMADSGRHLSHLLGSETPPRRAPRSIEAARRRSQAGQATDSPDPLAPPPEPTRPGATPARPQRPTRPRTERRTGTRP